MIKLENDLYLDADQYQFFIKRHIPAGLTEDGKERKERYDTVGSYPSLSTLIRGLSDSHLYDAVKRCSSLKAVQDDFVSWSTGFKSPLVSGLKDAVEAFPEIQSLREEKTHSFVDTTVGQKCSKP